MAGVLSVLDDRRPPSAPDAPDAPLSAAATASLILDRVRTEFSRWQRQLGAVSDIKLCSIMLDFSNFKDVAQPNFFLNLPTVFFLPATDVDRLREAGRGLLQDNPGFQDLLRDSARE